MRAGDRRYVLAAGLLAALPVLVSTVHAIVIGWIPLGDDAVIVARAYDVFSTHPPLLGQFSASSGVLRQDVHSLGPLQYWLLAIPAHIGPAWAPSVVTGLLNAAAVVGCVVLAWRRGGRLLAVAAAVGVTLACASLTAETWHVVWNPSVALLPLTLLAFVCWSVAAGEARLTPLAVLLASFVVQCHLTYVAPAAGALAVALAGLLLTHRGRRRELRRPALAALLVALVSWSAPLAESVVHRPGNLELVARSARAGGPKLGLAAGWHTVVHTVGLPPWWLRGPRPGVARLADVTERPSLLATLFAALVLVALAAIAVVGLRRRRVDVAAGAAIGLVLALGAGAVAASTPSSGILYISVGYTLWWASFAGMFCWLAVAWGLGTLAPRGHREARWAPAVGLAAIAVVGAIVALSAKPDRLQGLYRPVADASRRLDAMPTVGPRPLVRGFGILSPAGFDVPAGIVTALRRAGRAPRSAEYAAQFGRRYGSDPRDSALVSVGPPVPGVPVVTRIPVPGMAPPVPVTVASP